MFEAVGLCDKIEEEEKNVVLVNTDSDLTREQVVERILLQTDQYLTDNINHIIDNKNKETTFKCICITLIKVYRYRMVTYHVNCCIV